MNYAKFEEIKALMGNDFKLLVDTYIRDNTKRVEEIGNSINLVDYTKIKDIAHSMKSSSANIGADEVSNIASSIEQYANELSISRIQALFPILKKEIDEVFDILNN